MGSGMTRTFHSGLVGEEDETAGLCEVGQSPGLPLLMISQNPTLYGLTVSYYHFDGSITVLYKCITIYY